MWDLSCPDWEDRMRAGRSIIPDLPLITSEAEMGLAFFDELPLPDGLDQMQFRDACGQWFRDIVRVAFGSWDPVARVRYVRDIFAMAPKGSSKTTYSAGFMLALMMMNKRRNTEALFIGPTQSISDRAYEQAAAMIRMSPDLQRRFDPKDYNKTIVDMAMDCEMKVKTFDLNVLTGSKPIFVLLDELHVLGKNQHTTRVLRQIRGGLDKTPEGLLLITTTQSDDQPAGAFKVELRNARRVRDGHMRGREVRPMLPILYEFPKEIAEDKDQWQKPENWPMVMPNLGKSVHLATLVPDWNSELDKGDEAVKIWASQHLNIEIGVGFGDDGWDGADYWEQQADPTLTFDELKRRSEVVTVGIDGGGLKDLLGLAVIGRERGTRKWLLWFHAFANRKILTRHPDIATRLQDAEDEGSLTFCNVPDDVEKLADIVADLHSSGLLPEKKGIGLDPNNVGAIIEALSAKKIPDEMLWRVKQGTALSPALWGLERKLSDGTAVHSGSDLMNWIVGNVKVLRKDNGDQATKQMAGDSNKIDPFVAGLCGAILMSWNPEASVKLDIAAMCA